MRWPWDPPSNDPKPTSWLSTSTPAEPAKKDWTTTLSTTSTWTSPEILLPTLLLTTASLASFKLYTLYLRRIPTATYITPDALGSRTLHGYVTAVGDGDTFRLYHTPGGRWLGWGWLPLRRIQSFPKPALKDQTISVRVAGIDAPELAHFGKPAQVYGEEAREGLRKLVLGRFVRARLLRLDQYQRVVAAVSYRSWLGRKRDVGLEMLKGGHATVYEAKFGVEFGGMEEVYKEAERRARDKGVGLWKGAGVSKGEGGKPSLWRRIVGLVSGNVKEDKAVFETPRQFKDRTKDMEEGKAGVKKS